MSSNQASRVERVKQRFAQSMMTGTDIESLLEEEGLTEAQRRMTIWQKVIGNPSTIPPYIYIYVYRCTRH